MPFARTHNTLNDCKPKPRSNNHTSKNWPASKSSDVTLKSVQKADHSRWKPMGRIFKTVGLRWISTGKLFASSTTKVDSGPPYASNAEITNPYECIQTLDVSACTLNLKTCTSYNVKQDIRVWLVKRPGLGLHAMTSEQFSSGPMPQFLTTGYISSRLVPNLPPPSVVSLVPHAAAPIPADTTGWNSLPHPALFLPFVVYSPLENQIFVFSYREYDLGTLETRVLEFSYFKAWICHIFLMDTAYWSSE
ncbi:hypothetical protein Tco_1241843 [Tanacetum coccineum]